VTSTSVLSPVFGFTEVTSHGWGSPLTASLLGCRGDARFVCRDRTRAKHPLLPFASCLTAIAVARTCVAARWLRAVGTFLFLTYFLQATLHYSALRTGFASCVLCGHHHWSDGLEPSLAAYRTRTLMVSGLTLATLGLIWFTRLGVDSTYVAHVLGAEILTSIGMASLSCQ